MLESQGTSKFLNNKMTGDHSGFLSGMAPKHPDNSVSNMDSSVHYMFDEVDSSKILHDNNAILPRKRSDITPKSQIIQNEDLDENYIGNVHLPLRNEENVRRRIPLDPFSSEPK